MRHVKVPESGHPDDFGEGLGNDIPSMGEDDEGEVLQHEVVHGFRWYRVRVLTRSISTEVRGVAESDRVLSRKASRLPEQNSTVFVVAPSTFRAVVAHLAKRGFIFFNGCFYLQW